MSGLSVNVGESQITQSLKVRELGVTLDQFLNFEDHITAISTVKYQSGVRRFCSGEGKKLSNFVNTLLTQFIFKYYALLLYC